ncbi:tetratricopeptide repeat protein [Formosa algae]|uniref:Tetratricopeptide (TPR) repeat protein n=1 Tax=Formosa algae TaxID=225843 RepID=A0A9X1CAS2_9FLAO|nr:tetratricopeptide repeat protein [Formosa algae]MBP1838475.1 tetratricopeptide (TPR) repeat protein [Formosa algae]MDQ0334610.1 tetratricopeptide (TPR) repeat protein [Formosa algae]
MIENAKKSVIFGYFDKYVMRSLVLIYITLCTFSSFAQDDNEALIEAKRQANNFVFEGNEKIQGEDYVAAEMEYRKAISEEQANIFGIYNLGTSYYKKGNFEESLYRLQEAATKATDRAEKHKAFHNIGNILMQNKKCKEAVEAYKNALRNDPSDEETRYNFGLAKECAKEQEDQNQNNEDDQEDNKDQNQDNQDQNQDQNKDNKDQDDQDKKDEGEDQDQDKKDEGDQDKDEGDQEENEDGKPKDDKQDPGEGDQNKKEQPQQPKPQQGQMSPQQIKNLLEAMNNQEQKVQEKINAEKQKGERIKTDKDW